MPISLIVHGGAWDIPDDEAEAHRDGCRSALDTGWQALEPRRSAAAPGDPAELIVERERERWATLLQQGDVRTQDTFKGQGAGRISAPPASRSPDLPLSHPGDTVGAVALDQRGHLAAATSTGGTANKLPGRVGDSPLIGCGLYADDQSGGGSTTGWGESIIKVLLAKTAT